MSTAARRVELDAMLDTLVACGRLQVQTEQEGTVDTVTTLLLYSGCRIIDMQERLS